MVDDMPAGQFCTDILHRNAQLNHQHQHMVGKVGNFVDRLRSVLGLARDDDLGALLAHLFQNFVQTLSEQVRGVGAFGQLFLPAFQQPVQPLQLEFVVLFAQNGIVEAAFRPGVVICSLYERQ